MHTAGAARAARGAAAAGGGALDPDTVISAGSWGAAVRRPGAGLAAIDALASDEGDAAFLGAAPARPPRVRQAARWASACSTTSRSRRPRSPSRGERVADPRLRRAPRQRHPGHLLDRPGGPLRVDARVAALPGDRPARRRRRRARARARRATCRSPPARPATCTCEAFDEVVEPLVSPFAPDWMLVSAGFDAHRADPLTGLALSVGRLRRARRPVGRARPRRGRIVVFLEGGYDLDALRDSVAATPPRCSARRPTPPSARRPGARGRRRSRPHGPSGPDDRRCQGGPWTAVDTPVCWTSTVCCTSPSTSGPPTSTSRWARGPYRARRRRARAPRRSTIVEPADTERIAGRVLARRARRGRRRRGRVRRPRGRALPRERVPPARPGRPRPAAHRPRRARHRGVGPASRDRHARGLAARARAR